MAAEEDKKFDAVLGGFLVNDLRVRAGHLHCPESDVLAAYHERSLLPEEMNSWKEHIVGCARCQAILAELEATDSIPLHVSEKEAAALPDAAKPVAVTSGDRSAPPARVPEKSRLATISRGVRWQWLAPAGALAAGLLVWVAWHENEAPQVKAPAEVKIAKVEPPSVLEPPATRQAPASPSSDQSRSDRIARLSKDENAIRAELFSKQPTLPENLKQFEKSDSRVRTVPARPPAGKESGAREDAVSDLSSANPAQNQLALDNKAVVAGAASQTVEVQSQAANVQTQSQRSQQNQQNQLNAQKPGGPNPPTQAESAKKQKTESTYARRVVPAPEPAPPAPTASAAFGALNASPGSARGAFNLNLIAAPNKKVLWRAGRAGMIAFSSDGGASWSRQTSNVPVDLTSGSAPSDKVCWIVGRAGTILLTTDAGSHWAILHSPLNEDLGGVRATDALHAIIWSSANTKIFETADGGVTWKPAVSP